MEDHDAFFVELECEHLRADRRRSPELLDALLDDAFTEIGASGRLHTKTDVLRELPEEDGRPEPTVTEFHARLIAEHVALTTYTLVWDEDRTRRSSLWVREGGRWRLTFHQGTPS